jgi:chaperonin GroES
MQLFVFIVVVGGFIGVFYLLDLASKPKNPIKPKSPISYEPRGDRVIVTRLPLPQPKPGDVFLPASQQRPLNEGTVIAVGPGVVGIAPGDHVCFLDYAGFEIEVDGGTYLSMREEEIHGRRN